MNNHVWLLALCQSLMMTNNALLLTSSALVGLALADDAALATLPLAAQFLSTMIASVPASLMMARTGRRAGFLLGSVIGLAGGLIAVMAIIQQEFWLFVIGTALIGCFNGFGTYFRFAAVDIVAEKFKSRAISYVMTGGVLAAVLGPNLANWAHDGIAAAPFAGSYMAAASLYVLVMLILIFIRLPKKVIYHELVSSQSQYAFLKRPPYLLAVLSAVLGYAVMSLVMTATPLAMHHHHGLSDTAFVIQWHVLGMFAPSFVTGHLIKRYGVLAIMFIGAILLLVSVIVNLMGASLFHYWLALLLLGIGWNFVFIGSTDLITYTYNEQEKSRAQAVNDFSVFSAVSLAALTAGYLQSQFGWMVVNIGVLPLIMMILLAVIWLMLKYNKVEKNNIVGSEH